jgi:hypothetical protein
MIDLIDAAGRVTVTTARGAMRAALSAATGTLLVAFPHGTRCSAVYLDSRSSYCHLFDALCACEIVSRKRSVRWTSRALRRLARRHYAQ